MAGNISKIECSICKLCLSWLKPTASDKIMDGRTETGIRLLYITCSQLQLTETEAAIHQLMRNERPSNNYYITCSQLQLTDTE